jgi:predicted dehydrogenase
MPYRAALLGCGRIGSEMADDPRIKGITTHAGAYRAHPKTDLVAVCDLDAEKATRCAARWKVASVYSDHYALLTEQRPEIVSICTPDAAHADVLEKVLRCESVRAVWTEKPLALDLDRAKALVELAAARRIVVAVNYVRRYADSHVRVRELLRSGGLGRLQKVTGLYTKGVLHNGTHWFDLARWLAGEIRKVRAIGGGGAGDSDPTLDVSLEFENGATGALLGCDADAYSVFEMDLVGTWGRLRLLDSGYRIERFQTADSPYFSGYRALNKDEDRIEDLGSTGLRALEDLVRALEEGTTPRCSGADGLAALRLAFAAVKSAREGLEIDFGHQGR